MSCILVVFMMVMLWSIILFEKSSFPCSIELQLLVLLKHFFLNLQQYEYINNKMSQRHSLNKLNCNIDCYKFKSKGRLINYFMLEILPSIWCANWISTWSNIHICMFAFKTMTNFEIWESCGIKIHLLL